MIVNILHSLSFATPPLFAFEPFIIFVLSHALPGVLTPLVADILVILLVWLVLRQLLEQFIDVLRVTGGLFFFYLAYVLYRNARRMQVVDEHVVSAPDHTFGRLSFVSG